MYKPPGGLYLEGDLMEDFLRYKFEGLIFGILQYYKFILATSLKEQDILYILFP